MFIAARLGKRPRPQHPLHSVRHTLLAGLLAVSVVHAEPLSFRTALELAEQNAPELGAQAAALAATRAAAAAAGRLPDPRLLLGVDNVPTSGTEQWSLDRDFMTMQKIGVMQDIPNARKRGRRPTLPPQASLAPNWNNGYSA